MKICVDENIPLGTVAELKNFGHDVLDVRGTINQGVSDETLWQMIQQERRLLITTDKGFLQYRSESHAGILIVRLRQPNAQKIHERIMQAFRQFTADEWNGTAIVMRDMAQSVWQAE
ncbi:MAG: DUF5615 family PIN-like protein [Pyrinomonadaceae bacterium]